MSGRIQVPDHPMNGGCKASYKWEWRTPSGPEASATVFRNYLSAHIRNIKRWKLEKLLNLHNHHSRWIRMTNVDEDVKGAQSVMIVRKLTALALCQLDGNKHVEQSSKWRKAPVSEESWVSSMKDEAIWYYNSRSSSMDSQVRQPEVHKQVNNRLKTALGFKLFGSVGRSST